MRATGSGNRLMKFAVRIQRRARQDYEAILSYIAKRSPEGASAWARAFDRALERLEDFADTFPLAIENELVEFEVREILFKTRRGLVYRALFTIADNTVQILHVRGPGQDLLSIEELIQP